MNAPTLPDSVIHQLRAAETIDMEFERRGSPLYKFCLHQARRYNQGREASEDIAMRAIAKAWEHRAQCRGKSNPKLFYGWLKMIVRNAACDFYREERARSDRFEYSPNITDFAVAKTRNSDDQLVLMQLADVCHREVLGPIEDSCLSEIERRALHVVGWRELDNPEAAKELDLTAKDLENALYRARDKLRGKLQACGLLDRGERLVKDSLIHGFAPDSGQRRSRPHSNDE